MFVFVLKNQPVKFCGIVALINQLISKPKSELNPLAKSKKKNVKCTWKKVYIIRYGGKRIGKPCPFMFHNRSVLIV